MWGEAIFYLGLNDAWGLLQNEGSFFQNDHKVLEINIPTGVNGQNCNFVRGKYIKMRNLVKMEFKRSKRKNKELQIPCLYTLLKSHSNCTLCIQKNLRNQIVKDHTKKASLLYNIVRTANWGKKKSFEQWSSCGAMRKIEKNINFSMSNSNS